MSKKRVIVITDGDQSAREVVEVAAENINARCISLSGLPAEGDDTFNDAEMVELVLSTPHDPVVVMVDDSGDSGKGGGESTLQALVEHSDIEVIGVVAVASNSPGGKGVKVDVSVTRDSQIVDGPVDKKGKPQKNGRLHGDTVGILEKLNVPVIVGLGDPGKMDFADDARNGAPITTKALETVLKRHKELAYDRS